MIALMFSIHPGISYLVLAVAVIVAIAGAITARGVKRWIAPALVLAGAAGWLFLIPALVSAGTQSARSLFDAACREAGGEVRRAVHGVSEVFVEHDPAEPGRVADQLQSGLPNVDNAIAASLLREHPRFRRVAVYRAVMKPDGLRQGYEYAIESPLNLAGATQAEPVDELPRYGLRWRREAVRDGGIEPYRMEAFDRTTGEILATQKNFKQRDPLGQVRQCPITDPADFIRLVLFPTAA